MSTQPDSTPAATAEAPEKGVGCDALLAMSFSSEVAALLERWRNGEDVQDTMAHKLRHLAAGCATLQEQLRIKAARVLDIMRQRDRLEDALVQLRDTTSCTKGQYAVIDAALLANIEIDFAAVEHISAVLKALSDAHYYASASRVYRQYHGAAVAALLANVSGEPDGGSPKA